MYWFLFFFLNKVVVDRQTCGGEKEISSQTPERPKFVWMPSMCELGGENTIELLCDSLSQATVAGHMYMP